MRIIVKRKSKSSKSMKVNKPRKYTKSNNMKRGKKSKSKKSKSKKSYKGSGKDMLNKVPVLDKLVRNKTFQNIEKGSGRASVIGKLLKLVPNAQVQATADNPLLRAGLAYTNGGFEASVYQFVTDKGLLSSIIPNGNGGQQTVGQGGFA